MNKLKDLEEKEEAEEEVREKKKEEEERYALREVVTKTDMAVQDLESEKILTEKTLLIEILNKLDKIEKAVV